MEFQKEKMKPEHVELFDVLFQLVCRDTYRGTKSRTIFSYQTQLRKSNMKKLAKSINTVA